MKLWTACLVLGLVVVVSASKYSNSTVNEQCPDGTVCAGSSHCCPASENGYMCCAADEGCCAGFCCTAQTTYCCPRTEIHPDRCCPRWTVCCAHARAFGCCTPMGLPWRPWMGLEEPSELYKRYLRELESGEPARKIDTLDPNADPIFYVLFVESDKMWALTVNALNGTILSQRRVDFNNYRQITRIFMFDQKRELFYYVEANFTAPPGPQGRNVTLWTIDPATGGVKRTIIPGVYNFPTGYHYQCSLDRIFMATEIVDSSEQPTGWNFWAVDPASAKPTLLSSLSAAAADDPYAGWIHTVSIDGKTAYRLGFRDIDHQTDPGLSVTGLTSSPATNKFLTTLPGAPAHEFPSSIHALNATAFLSTAIKGTAKGGFDLVAWDLAAGRAQVIADFGESQDPPGLGWQAETLSCDRSLFTGVFYYNSGVGILDKWMFAQVDLHTGASEQVAIQPMFAMTNTVSGVGVPFNSVQQILKRLRSKH